MRNTNELYQEVKADLAAVSGPLFDLARKHISDRGAFLPFGATLGKDGKISLHAGANDKEMASSVEILPLVHAGLRRTVEQGGVMALGVCEWVKITQKDGVQTDAIKVLVEHSKGGAFRFYVPCSKALFKGWRFGDMMVLGADAEINAWGQ
jgi:hypothetical protein